MRHTRKMEYFDQTWWWCYFGCDKYLSGTVENKTKHFAHFVCAFHSEHYKVHRRLGWLCRCDSVAFSIFRWVHYNFIHVFSSDSPKSWKFRHFSMQSILRHGIKADNNITIGHSQRQRQGQRQRRQWWCYCKFFHVMDSDRFSKDYSRCWECHCMCPKSHWFIDTLYRHFYLWWKCLHYNSLCRLFISISQVTWIFCCLEICFNNGNIVKNVTFSCFYFFLSKRRFASLFFFFFIIFNTRMIIR